MFCVVLQSVSAAAADQKLQLQQQQLVASGWSGRSAQAAGTVTGACLVFVLHHCALCACHVTRDSTFLLYVVCDRTVCDGSGMDDLYCGCAFWYRCLTENAGWISAKKLDFGSSWINLICEVENELCCVQCNLAANTQALFCGHKREGVVVERGDSSAK